MASEENNNENILKEEVKRYLDITWTDADTEKDVDEYITEAKQYLNETTGSTIDYDKDITARGLLKDYCRYKRNKNIEFFSHNFQTALYNLRFKYAVSDMKSKDTEGKNGE